MSLPPTWISHCHSFLQSLKGRLLVSRVTNPQNEAAPIVPEMVEESAVDGPSFELMDSTPVPDFNGGAYDGEGQLIAGLLCRLL